MSKTGQVNHHDLRDGSGELIRLSIILSEMMMDDEVQVESDENESDSYQVEFG